MEIFIFYQFLLYVTACCGTYVRVVFSTATGGSKHVCHIILMNTGLKRCLFPVHLFYDIHNFPASLLDALVYHNPVCLNSRISITDDLILIHEPGCA